MESTTTQVEDVTVGDFLELASWDRQRSSEELQSFISRRESTLDLS